MATGSGASPPGTMDEPSSPAGTEGLADRSGHADREGLLVPDAWIAGHRVLPGVHPDLFGAPFEGQTVPADVPHSANLLAVGARPGERGAGGTWAGQDAVRRVGVQRAGVEDPGHGGLASAADRVGGPVPGQSVGVGL